jgi:hypothetical protein
MKMALVQKYLNDAASSLNLLITQNKVKIFGKKVNMEFNHT